MALSVQEFAAKIKAKYPAYQNVDDSALAQAMVKKHPEYASQVNLGASTTPAPEVTKPVVASPAAPSNSGWKSPGSEFPAPGTPEAGESFMKSPVGQFFNKQAPALQEAQNKEENITPLERGANVAGQFIHGVYDAGAGGVKLATNALNPLPAIGAFKDIVTGNYRKDAQGNPDMSVTPEDQQKTDQSSEGIKGLNQIISGIGQVVTSPLAASPVLQKGTSLPFEGAHDVIGGVLNELGVDPETDQGKTIADSLLNALTLTFVKPKNIAEGITNVLDTGKNAAAKITDTATAAKEKVMPSTFQAEALRSGLKEEHIGTVQNLTPEQAVTAKQFLDAGKAKIQDAAAPTVFQSAGKVIEDVYKQLQTKKKEAGATLGEVKKVMANEDLNTRPIKMKFRQALDDLNAITVKNGKNILDIEKSDLGGTGLASQVESMWKKLSENKKLKAKDVESMTVQIENKVGVGDGQFAKASPAGRSLLKLKTALNEGLGEVHPGFKAANETFAKLANGLQDALEAGKVKVGKSKYTISGGTTLQRLLSSIPEKTQAGLAALEKLAQEHGVEMPKDLQTRANLANLAEHYSGAVQPRSMKGIVEQSASHAGKAGSLFNTIKEGIDYVNPKMKLSEQIGKIQKLIDRAQEYSKAK